MIEPQTTRTYDEAFARARKERASAFRALFRFGAKPQTRSIRWPLFGRLA